MLQLKRLVLDVLKPHQPDVLEFARAIAAAGVDYRVTLTVLEMDDKTETLEMVIEGASVELNTIIATINELGASLHSIDVVEIVNDGGDSAD